MTDSKKYKILVVDDEDSQRNIYNEYLTMQGFHVLVAKDGQEALDIVHANNDIDMVLLDLMMPKVDGIRVLEQLKTDSKTKHLIIYIMTVLGTDAMIKHAFDLGADGYLVKDSVEPDQIRDEIISAIAKRDGGHQ
ncbi:MAG: two-component system, OmpR family, response regulator ResD [Patescibacteria group bacterium]|nr:two-component system, OmpR family, response regulator ResD [Patescibacteria group bacterium]